MRKLRGDKYVQGLDGLMGIYLFPNASIVYNKYAQLSTCQSYFNKVVFKKRTSTQFHATAEENISSENICVNTVFRLFII